MVRNNHLEVLDASEYSGNGQVFKCIVLRKENPPLLIHSCSGAKNHEEATDLMDENSKLVKYDLYDDVKRAKLPKGAFEFYKLHIRENAMEIMPKLI